VCAASYSGIWKFGTDVQIKYTIALAYEGIIYIQDFI